ncbi:MAG: alpha/beta hydrolase-fold protein [Chloroherpetonaceae bacterium]|nr:alpha/beta hydrolase-fold protein [Chloroherpetonaceae bacterium]
MKLSSLFVLITSFWFSHQVIQAQYPDSAKFQTFSEFKSALVTASNSPTELNVLWQLLLNSRRVPFAIGDSVAFLYRGNSSSVKWNGDFNNWGGSSGGTGVKIGNNDVWIWETVFPNDARLDYKIVLNGNNWILDPNNPNQQMSGFGPNSELRMPQYVSPIFAYRKQGVAQGPLTSNQLISSNNLGYSLHYRVYTPNGYNTLSNLPVIYVTDGQEYSHDQMGSMVITLDNLIAEGSIRPIIAVFISPVNPSNSSQNRRQNEYPMNTTYLNFVKNELVPLIDTNYKTAKSQDQRAILGTSLGGICAAFFGVRASHTFGLIGIQSPAFWYSPGIYTDYQDSVKLPLKVYMSSGTINDTRDRARQMRDLMQQKGYPLLYREVNEGHSWGNWRALMKEMLTFFFPPTPLKVKEGKTPQKKSKNFGLKNFPNPFNPTTQIQFNLKEPSDVTLEIYDALGKKVTTLLKSSHNQGNYSIPFEAGSLKLSSGVYFYKLKVNSKAGLFEETNAMMLVK